MTTTTRTPVKAGTPTQVAHPGRTTARTIVQQLLGWVLAAGVVLPAVLAIVQEELGHLIPPAAMKWLVAAVGVAVAISGAAARIMALPRVEAWLRRYLPGLATGVHAEAARASDTTLDAADLAALEHLRAALADVDEADSTVAALDKVLRSA